MQGAVGAPCGRKSTVILIAEASVQWVVRREADSSTDRRYLPTGSAVIIGLIGRLQPSHAIRARAYILASSDRPLSGEALRHDRMPRVLDIAGDDLVADGVPRQALRPTVIEPGELEQLAPHALEGLDGLP